MEGTMASQGEIEAAVCAGVTRFEQEYMGRGPKDIRAHLVDGILLVRLMGVLTAAELQLVKTLPAEKGRDLLKQVRVRGRRRPALHRGRPPCQSGHDWRAWSAAPASPTAP